ncbi:MAG: TolC family protein, partial [Proteobacteria bacterium]
MKTYFKLLLSVALLLVLSACKVSKDIETPKSATPAAFRSENAAGTTSIAQQDWRSFFPETTLQTLIDSALVRNNDLLVAQQNIEIARLQLKQAKWGNIPTVNLSAVASSTNPSNNSLNGLSLS